MRSYLSEKNIVVVLFVLVLITFSLAQEDSKKMEQRYTGSGVSAVFKQFASTEGNKSTYHTAPVKNSIQSAAE